MFRDPGADMIFKSASLAWLLVLAILLVGPMGCVGTGGHRVQLLEQTLRAYAEAVRWRSLDTLYAFEQRDPEAEPNLDKSLLDIRVTQYEVVVPARELSEGHYTQTVSIEYARPDQTVRRLLDQQVWLYDKADKRWYRENPLPAFK